MASPLEMENVSLDKEEPKKANFPLDVAEQTALLARTREHFQVIQVLTLALAVLALMVPFIPLWCKFNVVLTQGVQIGLNQMLIDHWVAFSEVDVSACRRFNVPDSVCLSAADFHLAGMSVTAIQLQIVWLVALVITVYNVANLHNLVRRKQWRWAQVEVRGRQFLHLVVPCFYYFAVMIWWVLSKAYSREAFSYQLGVSIALVVGISQSLLSLYYYRQRLRQDEAETPNYFVIPSN